MKIDMESSSHTPKDYDLLKQLEEYYKNSVGSHIDKITNFTKYLRSQDLRSFLARYELYKKILEIPGSIMECGIFYGGGLMAFAHFNALLEPLNHARKIVGFDTFSGFPKLADVDEKSISEFAKEGGLAVDSLEDLKKCIELYNSNRFIKNIPNVELVKGDATKTIPQYIKDNPHTVVSLLYLDFDIYEPTKIALETFIPRMPKGAIVVFDELNCKYWMGETQAVLDTIGIRKRKMKRFSFDPYRAYTILE